MSNKQDSILKSQLFVMVKHSDLLAALYTISLPHIAQIGMAKWVKYRQIK
ncbi:hypothetical protein ENHYD8BJ_90383 [Enhydrobacter sp. 8BJ]|nr:hypothetical protein ENHYD8BJ_90383 [Enhydrobacter sp. 8BJ]